MRVSGVTANVANRTLGDEARDGLDERRRLVFILELVSPRPTFRRIRVSRPCRPLRLLTAMMIAGGLASLCPHRVLLGSQIRIPSPRGLAAEEGSTFGWLFLHVGRELCQRSQ